MGCVWDREESTSILFGYCAASFKDATRLFVESVLITTGFIFGTKQGINPMILFGISMSLWVVSLLIINIVIFKNYPNLMSMAGFLCILIGVLLIHFSIQK